MSKFGKKDECGDDCIYRGLYEGSNASLNDMARSQADALQKNGRLRNAIILLMKRFFPDEFYKAEKNLSSRFLNVDDEIIIAFLTNFIEIMISDDNKSTSIETVISDLKNYFILNGILIKSNNITDIYQELLGYIKNVPINNEVSKPTFNSNDLESPVDKDNISAEYKSLGELFVNSVMEYKDDEGISPLIPRTIVKNNEIVPDQINVIEPLFPT